MTIFGQRAGPAMLALISQGSGALRQLTADMEDSGGTATRISDAQLATFSGQMLILKSNIESVSIEIGKALVPMIKTLTSAMKPVIAGIENFVKNNPGWVKAIGVATLGLAALAAGLLAFSVIVPIVTLGISALGIAVAVSTSPITLMVAAVATLGFALIVLSEVAPQIFGAIGKVIDKFVNTVWAPMINAVIKGINLVTRKDIPMFKLAVEDSFRGAGEVVQDLGQMFKDGLGKIGAAIKNLLPSFAQALPEAVVKVGDSLRLLTNPIDGLAGEIDNLAIVSKRATDAVLDLAAASEELTPRIIAQRQAAFDSAEAVFAMEGAIDNAGHATTTWVGDLDLLNEGLMLAEQNLQATAKAFGNMKTATQEAGETLNKFFPPMPEGIGQTREEQLLNIVGGPILTAKERVERGIADALRTRNEGLIASNMKLLIGLFPRFSGLIADLLGPGRGSREIPQFGTGGIVDGPIGRPTLAIVHGGEEINPPGRGVSGKLEITINVHGVGGAAVEQEVAQAVRNVVRKGGFDGLFPSAA